MERMDPKDLAKELSRFVNTISCEIRLEKLVDEMAQDDRTLQQNYMRLALMILERWSNMKYYDARNEQSVKVATLLVNTLKEHLGYEEDDTVEGLYRMLPHI